MQSAVKIYSLDLRLRYVESSKNYRIYFQSFKCKSCELGEKGVKNKKLLIYIYMVIYFILVLLLGSMYTDKFISCLTNHENVFLTNQGIFSWCNLLLWSYVCTYDHEIMGIT